MEPTRKGFALTKCERDVVEAVECVDALVAERTRLAPDLEDALVTDLAKLEAVVDDLPNPETGGEERWPALVAALAKVEAVVAVLADGAEERWPALVADLVNGSLPFSDICGTSLGRSLCFSESDAKLARLLVVA